jgi:hypothetical protein
LTLQHGMAWSYQQMLFWNTDWNEILKQDVYRTKISFNIITTSMLRSLDCPVPFRFSNKNFVFVCLLTRVCYLSYSSHSLSFDYPNILRGVKIIKLLIIQPTGSSLLSTLILISTVLWNTILIHSQYNGISPVLQSFYYKTEIWLQLVTSKANDTTDE